MVSEKSINNSLTYLPGRSCCFKTVTSKIFTALLKTKAPQIKTYLKQGDLDYVQEITTVSIYWTANDHSLKEKEFLSHKLVDSQLGS